MDSIGSLVDTNLKIFPSKNLLDYLKSLPIDDNVPINIARLVKGKSYEARNKTLKEDAKTVPVHLNSKDIENLNKIKALVKIESDEVKEEKEKEVEKNTKEKITDKATNNEGSEEAEPINKCSPMHESDSSDKSESTKSDLNDKPKGKKHLDENNEEEKESELHLITADIDWLYECLQQQRKTKADGDKHIPYLHVLLEGARIETPDNEVLKRNPVLEARCVKLRAQQEARDYRKMTKSVDNVRMRYPEDSISYQLKQMNRQLIAIGQFIISIFAGFLFGFRGVEWMVGNLDFGFRLLLGVICALIIALAEIYFLAKKLNEELNIPETIQIGGPPKFAGSDQPNYYNPDHVPKVSSKATDKEHQD